MEAQIAAAQSDGEADGAPQEPLDIVVAYDYGHVNGGAAKVAIGGAIGLAGRGHRVTYFSPVGPVDPKLRDAGVQVIDCGQEDLLGDGSRLRAMGRGLWNRKAAEMLDDVLKTLDPKRSVVYQHGWSKAMSPACQRAIAKSGLATLYHMHEYFAACPNGAFFNYQTGENCALKPLSPACMISHCDARAYGHKAFRVLRQGLANGPGRLSHNLGDLIYISELQLRVMSPWLPKDARLTFAPNPIEVHDVGPAPIADDAPFLFVGRLSREKGAALAAEAAASIGASISFIGDGELMADLRARAPNAEFTGWVPPEEATARMRGARALVFPSLWYECQPLTVLEALANGIPVIVSDNCAGAEFVADGESGLHFPSQSVEGLAAAMARIQDVETARRLGAAAHRRYWQAPHTLDRHLDVVEEALRTSLTMFSQT